MHASRPVWRGLCKRPSQLAPFEIVLGRPPFFAAMHSPRRGACGRAAVCAPLHCGWVPCPAALWRLHSLLLDWFAMRSSLVSFSRSAPLPRPTLTALAVAALFSSIPAAWAAEGDVVTPPTMSAVDVVGRSASGTYYADEPRGPRPACRCASCRSRCG